MGETNTQTKAYMSVNARFADLFNNIVYKGKQVINPLDLEQQDTTESLVINSSETQEHLEKIRDILKKAVIMKDHHSWYILLGIENQTEYHLAMPVRIMLYDAIRYSNQVQNLAAMHRQEQQTIDEKRKLTTPEFLSGLYKEDKLLPIITLTLYWNNKKWDAPKKLSEMLDIRDEGILPFLQDYNINLVEPSSLENFDFFQTDLGLVLNALKVSDDKEQMKQLFNSKEEFKHLAVDAVNLLNKCTAMNVKVQEKEDTVDMCKAFEDMKLEGIQEGIEQATTKAIQNMIKYGIPKEKILEDYTEEEYCLAINTHL